MVKTLAIRKRPDLLKSLLTIDLPVLGPKVLIGLIQLHFGIARGGASVNAS